MARQRPEPQPMERIAIGRPVGTIPTRHAIEHRARPREVRSQLSIDTGLTYDPTIARVSRQGDPNQLGGASLGGR